MKPLVGESEAETRREQRIARSSLGYAAGVFLWGSAGLFDYGWVPPIPCFVIAGGCLLMWLIGTLAIAFGAER